jgi:hypothetical protein
LTKFYILISAGSYEGLGVFDSEEEMNTWVTEKFPKLQESFHRETGSSMAISCRLNPTMGKMLLDKHKMLLDNAVSSPAQKNDQSSA